MALGTENMQSTQFGDLVMFSGALCFVLLYDRLVLFLACLRIGSQPLLGHGLWVASQDDVGTAAGHVGGNHDRAFATGL